MKNWGSSAARFFTAFLISWAFCALIATVTGVFAGIGYLSFHEHATSPFLYDLKGFLVVSIFGLLCFGVIYFIITLIYSLPLLVLVWMPSWFFRKSLSILNRYLASGAFGVLAGWVYWFVLNQLHAFPPNANEKILNFGSYCGACAGGCAMFVIRCAFVREELANHRPEEPADPLFER